MLSHMYHVLFFFFNDTATTEIYTLSLHDALPISNDLARSQKALFDGQVVLVCDVGGGTSDFTLIKVSREGDRVDRKSTRLNSSHVEISYAVFCLKKKKKKKHE